MKRILTLILIIVTFFASLSHLQADNSFTPLSSEYQPMYDDWVSVPGSTMLCEGYYQETPPPEAPSLMPGVEPPINITCLRGEFIEEGPSTLEGKVHLIQGTRQLFANRAVVYRNQKTGKLEKIYAQGNVKITEPGLRLEGSDAEFFAVEDIKKINNAYYRLYQRHARGQAQCITAFGKERLLMENATYTTCSPYENTWHLNANEVRLNRATGRGEAFHSKLYMKDVPIFYFPYVNFPIDDRRQTGFLFPIIETSNNSGLEIAAPFYWNIAPNYDATLTPRLYSRRGLNMEGLFRYLWPMSNGDFQVAYLPYDRLYRQFKQTNLLYHPRYVNNDPRVTALNRRSNARTAFLAKHATTFNKHLSMNLHYHTVGDDNYFMDFGNTLNTANITQLLQQGTLNYRDYHWVALLNVQQYQTLHPFNGPGASYPYERLPQFAFSNSYEDLFCDSIFGSSGEFTHFSHKRDPFTGYTYTTGYRVQYRPSWSVPIIYPGWFFKPRLQYDFLNYSVDLGINDAFNGLRAHPGRAIPMFDVDTGLIFDRPFCLFNQDFIQTLEPRAYYLYVPYRDQNALPVFDSSQPGFDYNWLYRDNRFSGLDRLGDANQLTLGITTRFFESCTGFERLNFTVGQIFYFRDRLVTIGNSDLNPQIRAQEMPDYNLGRSPLIGRMQYQFDDTTRLVGFVEWDTYHRAMNKQGLWFQYHPTDLNVLNIGYQFLQRNPVQVDINVQRPVPINQSDISFAWQLSEKWRMLGRWHYDLERHHSMDILAGLEHQGCCTALRFSVIRFLNPNPGGMNIYGTPIPPGFINRYQYIFLVQFVFKGFAGVGHNRLSGSLRSSIPGYQWRGDNF